MEIDSRVSRVMMDAAGHTCTARVVHVAIIVDNCIFSDTRQYVLVATFLHSLNITKSVHYYCSVQNILSHFLYHNLGKKQGTETYWSSYKLQINSFSFNRGYQRNTYCWSELSFKLLCSLMTIFAADKNLCPWILISTFHFWIIYCVFELLANTLFNTVSKSS